MNRSQIAVTGLGVTSAVGQGKSEFIDALLAGRHAFGVLQRPGRQLPSAGAARHDRAAPFLGAEIGELTFPESLPKSLLRTASLSGQVALVTLHEAWHDARLDDVDRQRIGLIVGGSNFQQRELVLAHEKFRDNPQYLRPAYALSFMDSDVCGLCTETFGIHGFASTAGGASASGQVALVQAIHAVESGQVDVCIALGALMDLSYWECQAFRSLGAMGSDRHASTPAEACRPFDADRDGFIFGEACGALVIERAGAARRSGVAEYARIAGWAIGMDANRNPNPSLDGEIGVIRRALRQANLSAADIDYVNPHGTGSMIGDVTELQALRACGLDHARLNATKSIVGHGLSAAGAVEAIAILLQMQRNALHPTKNLENPIDGSYNFVRVQAEPHAIENALNLSMGFGGVNSAVCLQRAR